MPLDLVRDVFEPVAQRVESRRDSLTELHRFNARQVGSGIGLEAWFKVEVVKALGKLVKRICNKGPDLELADDDLTVMIELKASTDLNTSLKKGSGSPGEAVTKYCHMPNFAGCLFLGDGSEDSKINQLSKDGVELLASQKIHDGVGTWIVGLLTSSTN
jgi:hypothetical protein